MPIDEWPAKHRSAWDAALKSGCDLLDDCGLVAHWRTATRRKVASSYGRLLTFVTIHSHLDPSGGPAELLTPEILRAFIAELERQVSPVTLGQRLTDLYEAFRVMAPETDFEYLRKAARRKAALARPSRNKATKVVHPRLLLELGIRLMEEAECFEGSVVKRACHYRNELMLTVLAVRPIRLSNLASIRIGFQLVHDGHGYDLRFDGEETKNHRPLERTLPSQLNPYIEKYLSVHRRVLLNGGESDALWISYLGQPLYQRSIYEAVCDMTEAEFGVRINPHLVRDCHATAIALCDPTHVRAAPAVLAHCDPATDERFYNQADMVSAAGQFQAGILELKRDLIPKRSSPRRRRKE